VTVDFPGETSPNGRLGGAGHGEQPSSLQVQHRIKNMLANIRALAAQTYRNTETLDEFYEAFEGRLQALALAHVMLGQRTDGKVNLTDLILEQFLSNGAGDADTVSVEGPDVLLEQERAQTFALVIHELMTNAIKFGALASDDGHIVVRWWYEANGAPPHFTFKWCETGVVMPAEPGASGLGRRLIEEALPHQLGGQAAFSLPPGGCRFQMIVPLENSI
jgi:two-component system CheB/CheR fusion protein